MGLSSVTRCTCYERMRTGTARAPCRYCLAMAKAKMEQKNSSKNDGVKREAA